MEVVTSTYTDVTPVYLPASSSSSSAVPLAMSTQNSNHASLSLGVCCNIAVCFGRTFRPLALPVEVFGPSSSDCPMRSLVSALVLGRPKPIPLQMQPVCTSFSCRFQILFVITLNADRTASHNSHSGTRSLTTPLPFEWQSDVCAAF